VWLTEYTRAKTTIETTRPGVLRAFVDAFRIFHTPPSFRVRRLERIFDDDTLAEIQRVARSLRPIDLELHEAPTFGRFVVHDHPYFTALHHRIVPIVSEVVGEPVEPAYSFLSLYGNLGVCPLHLDSPEAKWTLDLCVGQSSPWPIYFSQVCPWPELAPDISPGSDWEEQIKRSPSLRFTSCTLEPGQAVVFSGSSQWHYRDAIPDGPGANSPSCCSFTSSPRGARSCSGRRTGRAASVCGSSGARGRPRMPKGQLPDEVAHDERSPHREPDHPRPRRRRRGPASA